MSFVRGSGKVRRSRIAMVTSVTRKGALRLAETLKNAAIAVALTAGKQDGWLYSIEEYIRRKLRVATEDGADGR